MNNKAIDKFQNKIDDSYRAMLNSVDQYPVNFELKALIKMQEASNEIQRGIMVILGEIAKRLPDPAEKTDD